MSVESVMKVRPAGWWRFFRQCSPPGGIFLFLKRIGATGTSAGGLKFIETRKGRLGFTAKDERKPGP